MGQCYLYILASKRNGTLYVGMTNNQHLRVARHKSKATPGFTAKYNVTKLVYYEIANTAYSAIQREKQLKEWRRSWKIRLIESTNPEWRDLSEEL